MTVIQLIKNNLRYYFRKNLLLAAGVAISGAVLTGALMVGDSVKYSLNQIVEQRLGHITHVLRAGDRYFTTGLGERMYAELAGQPEAETAGAQAGSTDFRMSGLLLQEGSAMAAGGQRRVNRVQVLGIDPGFDGLAGTQGFYGGLSGDTVIISRNLANRLAVGKGDELLLRIGRASLMPLNAPFVSDAESVVTFRAVIRAVAGEEQMGRFNLKVSQTAPFNVFVSLDRLAQLMDFSGRINVLLVDAGDGPGTDQLEAAFREQFTPEDAGLEISRVQETGQVEVSSHRVFIDDVLNDYLARPGSEGILTYFVNRLESGGRSTPYSFVSTVPDSLLGPGKMLVSSWLAEDLGVKAGDSVRMSYFVVGPLRELEERSTSFVIAGVVPREGRFADQELMPDLPGLSDVGNCRDWETGVPISLDLIRDKDEDYWDAYRGLPKAFVSASTGKTLWHNRFGTWTAFRYPAGKVPGGPGAPGMESLKSELLEGFDPALLGFTLEESREQGMNAAASGVDFSQLFGGLSFFLLVAGILLTVLLFLMNLESRYEQLSTLVTMGIPLRTVSKLTLGESMLVALAGSLVGLPLAVAYNHLVFAALNGVWSDAVRTDMMFLDIRWDTLATGLMVTLFIAFLAIWLPLRRRLRKRFRVWTSESAEGGHEPVHRKRMLAGPGRRSWVFWLSAVTGLTALVLIGWQLAGAEGDNVMVFFSAGGLLLVSALSFVFGLLSGSSGMAAMSLQQLSRRNARRNLVRSMSIVILFAIGAFLVITTGSNRKDMFANSEDPGSGTGGFLYFAESTAPVLRQLNDPEVRYEFGLSGGYRFVQLRKAEGDDASCLNLNLILNPQVLGVDPEQLEGRFSFVTRTPYLDASDPWASLNRELEGGVIPAIADETVIKWGLGLTVGDTLHYTNSGGGSMDLLLIGGLAPSIFQGNVLIADQRFLEQFPESSGTNVFLVDGAIADTTMIRSELGRGMRDLGWDMELTGERLTRFYSVTNTYLSIFMALGALGLLVGTFGLVVVLSRSILERRQEIALLKAVGYRRRDIRSLVVREYMILLLAGIGTGFGSAIVATLPSLLNPNTGTSFISILVWLGILLLNGWIWIQLVSRSALNNESLYQALRND
jgi:putative ABC transport system permease protein